jgi:hypothetical protein
MSTSPGIHPFKKGVLAGLLFGTITFVTAGLVFYFTDDRPVTAGQIIKLNKELRRRRKLRKEMRKLRRLKNKKKFVPKLEDIEEEPTIIQFICCAPNYWRNMLY